MGNHINLSEKLSFPGQTAKDFAFHCCCCSHTLGEVGKIKEKGRIRSLSPSHNTHTLTFIMEWLDLPSSGLTKRSKPTQAGRCAEKR